jgi:HMG (high mobility group) box
MLRHTGKKAKVSTRPNVPRSPSTRESSQSKRTPKKMTPYTLYMKEKYVSLKSQYNDNKKAIFAKCHEMWEKESPEVKKQYERRVSDNEEVGSNVSGASWSASDFSDPTSGAAPSQEYGDPPLEPLQSENESLSLESAIQFAGLVAANHVSVETRELKQLDSGKLLQKAAIFQEI